jgi:hypothetical protein
LSQESFFTPELSSLIRMQVMLSVPIPSSVFGARISSKSFSTQFARLLLLIPGFA